MKVTLHWGLFTKQSPQGVTPSSPPSVLLLVLAVGSEPSSPPRRDTGHISIIIHDSSVRLLWCIWIKTPSSPCALWQNDNHGWLDWQITSVVMILLEWKRAPSWLQDMCNVQTSCLKFSSAHIYHFNITSRPGVCTRVANGPGQQLDKLNYWKYCPRTPFRRCILLVLTGTGQSYNAVFPVLVSSAAKLGVEVMGVMRVASVSAAG